MRQRPRALLIGALACAAATIAACGGGSGLLSSDQASSLSGQLDQVTQSVGSGQCSAAGDSATQFDNAVSDLSGNGINPGLVQNLRQGAALVQRLAVQDCSTSSSTTSTTSTSSSPTTSTSTSSSTPTTTVTTSSIPTSTATSSSDTGSSSTSNGGAGISGGPASGGAGTGGNGVP